MLMESVLTVPAPARIASAPARTSWSLFLSAADVKREGVNARVLVFPSAVRAKCATTCGLLGADFFMG
jgi:hypothetical protein